MLTENILHLNVLDFVVSGFVGQLQQWSQCSVLSREFCSLASFHHIQSFLPAGLQPLKRPSLDLMVSYVILHNPSTTNETQMQPCEHDCCCYEASCRMKPWQHLSPQSMHDLTLPKAKHFQLSLWRMLALDSFLVISERSLGITPPYPLMHCVPYSCDQT